MIVKMIAKIKEGRITYFFLLVAVFFLPVWKDLFVIALWPWIFFFLLEIFINKEKFRGFYSTVAVYLLPAFFFLLLLSLIWSENKAAGLDQMGRSVLMLIIPFLLGMDSNIIRDQFRIHQILKIYVFGTTVALIFLWINAFVYSVSFSDGKIVLSPLVGEWENAFYHMAFSFLIHPTYFGMMVLMAAAVCLNEIKANNLFTRSPVWPVLLSIIFIGSLFFISSRAMIGAAIAILICYMIFRISNKRILLVSLLITIVALFSVASLHPRFSNFRNLVTGETGIFSYEQFRKTTDRGKTWQAAYLLISENPILGVGIGDVKDTMTRKYRELGFYSETDHYLNCHNQFIESWLATGIIEFLFLGFILIYPIFRIQLHNKFLYGSFLIICLIAFFFESILNRLWGVAFFSIFYLLLTLDKRSFKKIA